VLLLYLLKRSQSDSIMLEVSPLLTDCPLLSMEYHGHVGIYAMQFLNALMRLRWLSFATVTDVTNVAFISRALHELSVTLCVETNLCIMKVWMFMLRVIPMRAQACMCLLLMSLDFVSFCLTHLHADFTC
jgi:hypothetical protein